MTTTINPATGSPVSDAEIIERLRLRLGTMKLRVFAAEIETATSSVISVPYLSNILQGRRAAPDFVLRYLGLERRTIVSEMSVSVAAKGKRK